ncbi:uncharacterized protein BO95DRAFT_437703 [Aspergillus brunneoviolaceus CBS 621.78]|uniref:Uncharacterized protein n=1 Tax=Aspergillus brunneoviolaceus CBS 621.78 TaxID=1450534 RepID=A0ACD1GQI1_9EURO|nr:hypothetical protein BO95DRAFT_437703 [Aspergillus brunneoviolaceus CBS 621.78]RAH51534.1 hypothetical protein BO95DRAFT_437703 [Aspergillus brunneoviolaceus CBS 621.78]
MLSNWEAYIHTPLYISIYTTALSTTSSDNHNHLSTSNPPKDSQPTQQRPESNPSKSCPHSTASSNQPGQHPIPSQPKYKLPLPSQVTTAPPEKKRFHSRLPRVGITFPAQASLSPPNSHLYHCPGPGHDSSP